MNVVSRRVVGLLSLSLGLLGTVGCGGEETGAEGPGLARQEQALISGAPYVCLETTCAVPGAAYISHFSWPNCGGNEYYYTPYFSGTGNPNPDGIMRPWDGLGLAGTVHHTVTVYSYRDASGTCHNAWSQGNTLANFVRIYRKANNGTLCGEKHCSYPQGRDISRFSGLNCGGKEYHKPGIMGDGLMRTWDGLGIVGQSLGSMTLSSYRNPSGECVNYKWSDTHSGLANVYRP
ncbi:hypothetical protein ACN28I_00745 [Archangium gephyra]|uniref:hypothetical protein n=1 Tax=Archangium gephyra TaxID=48 RepID=UPI003B768C51